MQKYPKLCNEQYPYLTYVSPCNIVRNFAHVLLAVVVFPSCKRLKVREVSAAPVACGGVRNLSERM